MAVIHESIASYRAELMGARETIAKLKKHYAESEHLRWELKDKLTAKDERLRGAEADVALCKAKLAKARAEVEDLKVENKYLIEAQRCECSADDMCRFAAKRDEARRLLIKLYEGGHDSWDAIVEQYRKALEDV
jgi:chromosome segregation ATPase